MLNVTHPLICFVWGNAFFFHYQVPRGYMSLKDASLNIATNMQDQLHYK